MHYIIVDLHNMLHRAKHVAKGDIYLQTGMSLHILFTSLRSVFKKFEDAGHVVFCSDGKSWRKDFYPAYKANRAKIRTKKTQDEQEEDRIFFEMIRDVEQYIEEKTNCTFLQDDILEADDLVAGFIRMFDNNDNMFTIISSDTDFQQLLSDNVRLYDGVQEKLTTIGGVFDSKGNPFKGKENEKPKPDYMLFEKCIRGDKSDNIESAYPGCRKKGTKNKIGILEAFEDKDNQGYSWNNFMLQSWIDIEGNEQIVKDCYERNRLLIDLNNQPEEIKEKINKVISEKTTSTQNVSNVGFHFLKFCAKHELKNIAEYPNEYVKILNRKLH